MAQRKTTRVIEKTVVVPKRVWMVNFIGEYVDVSPFYLTINFQKSPKMKYLVNARTLYTMLSDKVADKRYIGDLQFSIHTRESGEVVVQIEPDEEADFQFGFDVNKKELEEALYYFVG